MGSLLFMNLIKLISHFGDIWTIFEEFLAQCQTQRQEQYVSGSLPSSGLLSNAVVLAYVIYETSLFLKFQDFQYYIVCYIIADFVSRVQLLSFQLSLLGLFYKKKYTRKWWDHLPLFNWDPISLLKHQVYGVTQKYSLKKLNVIKKLNRREYC